MSHDFTAAHTFFPSLPRSSGYGVTSTSGAASANVYQYTGRPNDGTGLYYNRARYYNPAWGRFISEDPIGLNAGPNVYAYVGGNPITNVDPFGQSPYTDFVKDQILSHLFGQSFNSAIGRAFPGLSSCEANAIGDIIIDILTIGVPSTSEIGIGSLVYDWNFDVLNPPIRAPGNIAAE
jgi:RHS repeat-associated protein